MKRLRSRIGGNQLLFVPILPKPAATAIPANMGVATASSKNTVTSVANNQLSGSLGNDSMTLLSNLPVLDLSSSSIVVAQNKSTPPVQHSGNMVTQGTTSLNESTLPVSSSWNLIAQGPSPASATVTVPQNLSGQPFHSSGNVVPQGQSPSSSETAFRPAAVDDSFNMLTQNQLLMPTPVVAGDTSIPPFQNSGNMVRQGQLQEFVSAMANQPILATPSQIASFKSAPLTVREVEQNLRVISEGRATPLIGDTNGNLDISGNRNMLQETETGSQTINEVMVGLRDPMWAQSPGLTTLANASEIVQREQHIDSIANSSNLQVL